MTDKRKREFTSPTFRKQIKEQLGSECINCGSREGIEYHHIVPIAVGGTNRITNIVPICHACHIAAHTGRHIMNYDRERQKHTGRNYKTPYEECIEAYEMYAGGEIGRMECEEYINTAPTTKIYNTPSFKKFKEEYGIIRMKNTRDLSAKKNGGEVREDGYILEIEFGDPNPGVYYVVGGEPITEIVRSRRKK